VSNVIRFPEQRNGNLGARRRKRQCVTDVSPIRRREIERLVKGLRLAGTDDLPRFLKAWVWHNRKSTAPLWALINAAERRMGVRLTDADAREILDAAWDAYDHHYMTQDGLAEWLGLPYAVRKRFRITTIGACDVGRAAREVLRKRQNKRPSGGPGALGPAPNIALARYPQPSRGRPKE
jgi:hypothetical protein